MFSLAQNEPFISTYKYQHIITNLLGHVELHFSSAAQKSQSKLWIKLKRAIKRASSFFLSVSQPAVCNLQPHH